MPILNCCGFGRTISPNPQPIRLVDNSQPKARFALSSHSLTPVEDSQNARTIRESLQKTSEDNGPQMSSVTSGHDLRQLHGTTDGINHRHSSHKLHGLTGKGQMRISTDSGVAERSLPEISSTSLESELLDMHDVEDGVYRRHSSRTLHGVAGKIRKRMSRDSGMSRRSSKRLPRNSPSLENTDRRAELKRALHQRVKVRQFEILFLICSEIRRANHVSEAYASHTVPRITWRLTASHLAMMLTPNTRTGQSTRG